MYNELVKKAIAIDTNGLVTKRDHDNKIDEIKGKIPSITGLATTAALTVVENKKPNVTDLVKKADHDAKIKNNKN